ncbi:tetratricopeptide repeat protein [Maribacter spongiicola]|uniref:tetratricopeptide repeat protein n=1 Tax=Maribacter spongiicola TaxID=1206753 RepID=UPI003F976209
MKVSLQKSISEFQRALNQSKNMPEAHFGMAKAYGKTGEIEKAKEHIQKAEEHIASKREDHYNEFLNEIYLNEILDFKKSLEE